MLDNIKKLRFVPKEVVIDLVIKLYRGKGEQLKEKIKPIIKRKRIKDPFNYVSKFLTQDALVKILSENLELKKEEVDRIYEEFWDSYDPAIYLSILENPHDKTSNDFDKELPLSFENKNQELSNNPESSIIQIKLLSIVTENDINEITFNYQKRIDYIDTKTAEPAYVYGLKGGIIWLSVKHRTLVIKAKDGTAVSIMKDILRDFLGCSVNTLKLPKDVINNILGKDTLVKGNYTDPRGGKDKINKKILLDSHLLGKEEGRQTDETYDRISSSHKVDFNGEVKSIGTTMQYGKLSISGYLPKSELRRWTTDIMEKVVGEVNTLKNNNIEEYFKSVGVDLHSLDEIKHTGTKQALLKFSGYISELKKNDKNNIKLPFNTFSALKSIREYVNISFLPLCTSCDSGEYKCKICGAENSLEFNKKFELSCSSCGKEIKDTSDLLCKDGHQLDGSLDDNIFAFVSSKGLEIINKIFKELGFKTLDKDEVIKIDSDSVSILKTDYKYEYTIDEMPEFSGLKQISDIPSDVRTQQNINLNNLKETCQTYNGNNCRSCLLTGQDECLRRVVASVANGQLGPHSPVEFGDLTFRTRVDGGNYTVVCLVKSRASGNLTIFHDGRLIPQILQAKNDSLIEFIAIVSSAYIDARLREQIKQIIVWARKKVVFIETDELIRILEKYYR